MLGAEFVEMETVNFDGLSSVLDISSVERAKRADMWTGLAPTVFPGLSIQAIEANPNTGAILHRRVGPFQQGLGLFYGMASSGGATAGQLTLGTLPAQATVSVLLYDRANQRPAALREVRIDPDQAVTLTPWEAFPEMPTTSVDADLSPAASS